MNFIIINLQSVCRMNLYTADLIILYKLQNKNVINIVGSMRFFIQDYTLLSTPWPVSRHFYLYCCRPIDALFYIKTFYVYL